MQTKRCSLLKVLTETATPIWGQDLPVLDEAPLPGGTYDVSVNPEGRDDDPWPLLVKACEGAFGVRIRRARRNTGVYVLAAPQGRPGGLRPARPGERSKAASTASGYSFEAWDMRELARFLAMNLSKTVVNETAIKGAYTFELKMDGSTQTELLAAVKELGLELKEAQRPVEVIVVQKAGSATSAASDAR